MNVKNNKRRRESQDKIEKAFLELLQPREIKEITVSDIIKLTGLNRSTFYANYIDIFDLADKTREKLEADFSNLFADYDYVNEHSGVLKMFTHIKENQFFRNGLNAIIKMWLAGGCQESAKEMAEVLKQEYRGANLYPMP